MDAPSGVAEATGIQNEFDELQWVLMRRAIPFSANLDPETEPDPAYRRQLRSWRWSRYDVDLVQEQLDALRSVLEDRGVHVIGAPVTPDCDSQHFPRDIGFVVDDTLIVGRPRHHIRQWEIVGIRGVVAALPRVAYLDAGFIEGGDVMLHDDLVLVGLGGETSPLGVDSLRHRLEHLGSSRTVMPIATAHPAVVHLDTLFNIVAPNLALVLPSAFEKAQIRWFSDHFDLIEVTEQEALGLEINTLSVDPRTIVASDTSRRVRRELERREIEVVPVDFSEVSRIPGAFRCATLPLRRG